MSTSARVVLFPWVAAAPVTGTLTEATTPRQRITTPRGASRSRGNGLVGWRALGANNRELGRAAAGLTSTAAALHAVEVAQTGLAAGARRIVHHAGVGWSWRISLDDEWLVSSSRRYQRQRECTYSLEQFCEWFPTAAVVLPALRRQRRTTYPDYEVST